MRRYGLILFAVAVYATTLFQVTTVTAAPRRDRPMATPTPTSAVIPFTVVKAVDAVRLLQRIYPGVHFAVDQDANALVVTGTPDQLAAVRSISSGIDTKNPLAPLTQSVALHRLDASEIASRLQPLFPRARFAPVNRHSILISADTATLQQIQAVVSSIDAPPATPPPIPAIVAPSATEAVRIFQAHPKDIARQLAGALHGLRVLVAGQSVIVSGQPDQVQRAKDLVAVLDTAPSGTRYTALYRIKTLDAKSVADLLRQSFPNVTITVDEDINSLSVLATVSEQRRIADGLAQLDSSPTTAASGVSTVGAPVVNSGSAQVYTLKYALPGQTGSSSTSATDLATMVSQTLASQAPDLHVSATASNSQLILTGSPYSIKLAKDLVAQLDVPQQLVVLDTEILEVDENTAKNLGLQMSNAVGGAFSFGTAFSEVPPIPDPTTGITPPLQAFRPLTRTPLGFIAVLNLAIQHGSARVLADPRITTLSGHTATIRAGDNISIQLQAGGGAGTVATTQIQTFQTGVALDITPIVNADGLITVSLHPVVNSLTGILNGIPQISTRDTQTTVALKENETLVIGGLIQDNTQHTESRLPILGDLPIVGRAFRNQTLNGNRNELIISVTPHILTPGQSFAYPGPALPSVPTPQPLPTLPAWTHFPEPSRTSLIAPMPLTTSSPVTPNMLATPLPLTTASPSPTPVLAAPAASAPPNFGTSFVYGSVPQSNTSKETDPARIYFVRVSPTQLFYGESFTLTAVTSTNVASVALSYSSISMSIPQTGPGKWGATLPFTLIPDGSLPTSANIAFIASKSDGTQATISIPITVLTRSSAMK